MAEFTPVQYASMQYPAMQFYLTLDGVEVPHQFVDGVFLADTAEMQAAVQALLKRVPSMRAHFRVVDREAALATARAFLEARNEAAKGITGVFTSAHTIAEGHRKEQLQTEAAAFAADATSVIAALAGK